MTSSELISVAFQACFSVACFAIFLLIFFFFFFFSVSHFFAIKAGIYEQGRWKQSK